MARSRASSASRKASSAFATSSELAWTRFRSSSSSALSAFVASTGGVGGTNGPGLVGWLATVTLVEPDGRAARDLERGKRISCRSDVLVGGGISQALQVKKEIGH